MLSEQLPALAQAPIRPSHLVLAPPRGTPFVVEGCVVQTACDGVIYAQEDPAQSVYQVVAGAVRTLSHTSDGRRIIHGFHLPGEIFGLEREKLHLCSAEAVCDARLVRCGRAQLQALADEDMRAADAMWWWLLLSRDRTADRLHFLTRANAVDKVADFLIDIAQRTGSAGRIELPMSRYDIADYLGLSPETVSRAFSALREKGLIACRGRSVLILEAGFRRIPTRDDGEPRMRTGEAERSFQPPRARGPAVPPTRPQ
jgi:CRP-like cAMP-binding protein